MSAPWGTVYFPDGVEVVRDLDRIFRESDYVSLHAPNTPVTHDMVDMARLKTMKPIDYNTAPTYTDTKKPDKKPAGMFDF